jgi:hypothetical protein
MPIWAWPKAHGDAVLGFAPADPLKAITETTARIAATTLRLAGQRDAQEGIPPAGARNMSITSRDP